MSARTLRTATLAVGSCVVLFAVVVTAQFWPQWALNPQHTGQVTVAAQPPNRILASIVYDPLVPDEMAANGGDLDAHYQVPLIDSDRVFMEFKSGTYNKNRYSTQTWGENGFQWQAGQLIQVWSFTTDWKAPGSQADFWEPVFHGVLANGSVYVPGAGGTLLRLNEAPGVFSSASTPSASRSTNRSSSPARPASTRPATSTTTRFSSSMARTAPVSTSMTSSTRGS
jgi:hypothetical protein